MLMMTSAEKSGSQTEDEREGGRDWQWQQHIPVQSVALTGTLSVHPGLHSPLSRSAPAWAGLGWAGLG